jgi:hypothetical protein
MQFSEVLSAGLGKFFGKDRISSVGPFAEEGTITITYRIRGVKGSPEEAFATVSIPWKLFVANLIDLIGEEVKIGVDLIGEAMRRSFQQQATKQQPDHLQEVLRPVTEAAEACVDEMIQSLPKIQKDGKTLFHLLEIESVVSSSPAGNVVVLEDEPISKAV